MPFPISSIIQLLSKYEKREKFPLEKLCICNNRNVRICYTTDPYVEKRNI